MHPIAAIEAITRNCYRSFARFPGAQLIDDGRRFGVISGVAIPFFSGIASTELDAGDLDVQVEETIALFRAKRSPFRWWVTPSTRPRELAPILAAHGMRHVYDAPGMLADLTTTRFDVPLPAGVTIRRLRSADELTPWLDVFLAAFSLPETERAIWRDANVLCGFGDDAAWQHFVAFAEDSPVATASVLVDGALAGIYYVATLPSARGRGIGSAITLAAMAHARDAGATRAALQSSKSGFNVYRNLGFVEHCDLSVYDWRP